ncbi:RIP metalloprotease RseP [Sandaracinus amylolyticus]|uniref:Membrane-associated zinc metalloprotease n=1 Tax=Sandaracinus amylolyticus TaxID=927083 RepID=A0A0F6W1V4_9BACT|nr:RIP metalloprotease RseP [Sandaracinus amylolyticus]AKF05356.1 Membrane-associated zinc metalloprotease [Sandaracinus amylolyticus]
MAIVYFVVLVGVLIFVHELGHFAWAKFFGVKVLKFSLGFGPRIAGIQRGDTEYVIAAFPLGGYVRMLGETPNDTVAPEDAGRSFAEQPLWKRFVIVLAGPAMNLAFPVLLYFVVAYVGPNEHIPATIGTVFPDRPAAEHLLPGDRIVAIDGDEISTWIELNAIVTPSAGRPLVFTIERDGQQIERSITPTWSEEERPLDLRARVGRIGVSYSHPLAVIGITSPSQPAAAAGLRTFDRVVAAGGRPIERWIDLQAVLERNRGSMLPITYLRPQRLTDALSGLADLDLYEPHVATLTPEGGSGSGIDRAGLESSDLYVARVVAGSAEHRAGLLPGDRLISIDGQPILLWPQFLENVRAHAGEERTLVWKRNDQEIARRIQLTCERTVEGGVISYRYGFEHFAPTTTDPLVPHPAPFGYALRESLSATWMMIELTGVSLVRLFQGRVSPTEVGGPLEIARQAQIAARGGSLSFLQLMAFISINLGLLNLLPIPVLDGGHLFFFAVEGISRRPVSRRLRELASLTGLAMLVIVMVLVFTNDVARQWPDIVAAFEALE